MIIIVYKFAYKFLTRLAPFLKISFENKLLFNPKMLVYEYLPYLLFVRDRWYLDLQITGLFLRWEKRNEEQEKIVYPSFFSFDIDI